MIPLHLALNIKLYIFGVLFETQAIFLRLFAFGEAIYDCFRLTICCIVNNVR